MTRYLAVTTCNAKQWEQFGRRMASTFAQHWPADVSLRVYAEEIEDFNMQEFADENLDSLGILDRVGFKVLDDSAPWLPMFKALYRDPKYNGGANGRDYRHDAVRFAHKVAAIGAAAEAKCDVLIWIDADVVTHARVTTDWLESLFPEPATIAWLDRVIAYPECGFLMFRMPAAGKIIHNVVMMYRTGALFQLAEWHDSFVIQHVVNAMVQRGKAKVHSLSGPDGQRHTGHPWIASPLAAKMDHLKGETRKARGMSLAGDVPSSRAEPYWQKLRAT